MCLRKWLPYLGLNDFHSDSSRHLSGSVLKVHEVWIFAKAPVIIWRVLEIWIHIKETLFEIYRNVNNSYWMHVLLAYVPLATDYFYIKLDNFPKT